MMHLEVNWKDENEEARVIRDLRPLAFKYDSRVNALAVYNNKEEFYRRIPHNLYKNVTSIEYWDDSIEAGKDCDTN